MANEKFGNENVYEGLRARLRRVHVLGSVAALLGWDEQVNLPEGAAGQRAAQAELLAELHHAAATDPELGAVIGACEQELAAGGLDEDVCVVVKAARRDYDRVTRLPVELAAEKARLSSEGYHVWAAARKARDFSAFAPVLEKHLAVARREAELLGFGERPYDLAIDRHDPGLTVEKVGELFAELREGLVPLVRRIDARVAAAKQGGKAPAALRGFDIAAQQRVVRAVTAGLGFDYKRGRLDVSLHPFCEGSGDDVRLTTRFNPDDPLDALYSSIHEAGHGLYEQGLPVVHAGTALGNMIAAQLWTAARRARPSIEEEIARGEFGGLLDWLRAEVHARGRREDAFALTLRVTGEPLGPKALLAYLEERYGN